MIYNIFYFREPDFDRDRDFERDRVRERDRDFERDRVREADRRLVELFCIELLDCSLLAFVFLAFFCWHPYVFGFTFLWRFFF